jgi:hypothetical protein
LFVTSAARVKKTLKAGSLQTKFKVRCSRYLYTLVVDDADKADKLRQSLPPGEFCFPLLLWTWRPFMGRGGEAEGKEGSGQCRERQAKALAR